MGAAERAAHGARAPPAGAARRSHTGTVGFMAGIDRDGLRNHLAGRHGAVTSSDVTLEELLDHHFHEHTGPCGIRNHPIDDLEYDPTAAQLAFAEAADSHDTDHAEWLERSQRVTLERVALCAAAGAETGLGSGLTVTAHPENPDDGDSGSERRFYVDFDELTHADGGTVTGVRRVRWELHLRRVGPLPTDNGGTR